MTALEGYERLEAPGIWRASAQAPRQEVIVTVGDATLAIYDSRETPVTHWSLPAVERLNPGALPAQYAPGADATETLEIDDETMIEAIETVRRVVARRRPRRGRVRLVVLLALVALIGAGAVFWLPGALVRHAASVVPPAGRSEFGQRMLAHVTDIAGAPCRGEGEAALAPLAKRVLPEGRGRIVVLRGGLRPTQHLPGRIYLVDAGLIEMQESPDALAGHLLAETARAAARDPMLRLLDMAGPMAALRLLTTGTLPEEVLKAHAEALLLTPPAKVSDAALRSRFAAAGLPASAFAAIRPEGEVPAGADSRPVMNDSAWVRLQGICSG